jgi:hypothetical protein
MVWETIAEQPLGVAPRSCRATSGRGAQKFDKERMSAARGARPSPALASTVLRELRGDVRSDPSRCAILRERLPAIELSTTESGQVGSPAGVDRLGRGADRLSFQTCMSSGRF